MFSVLCFSLCLILSWKVCTVQAQAECQSGAIRLVGGSTNLEGRVEVSCDSGSWGTVCDDSWNLSDASVACNQLGYGYASDARSGAYFGHGYGAIVLENLHCVGNETSLFDCPHGGINSRNCGHAGVTCSGITPFSPPSAPLRLSGSASSTKSITLSWSPPTNDYGALYTFVLTYQDIQTGSPRRLVTINFNDQRQLYTISGLQHGARYRCCIYAENSAGQSQPSRITVEINQAAPSGSPLSLISSSVSPTEITLSWSPPHYSKRNGLISAYSVMVCQSTLPSTPCENHNSNNGQITISLHPDYEYNWSVAAHTAVGRGPYSGLRTFQMPEDAPSGFPAIISNYSVNPTSVTLVWRELPLFERNGRITNYRVEVCQITPHGSCRTDYHSNGIQLSLVISLHPDYEYTWRVAACTAVGHGPYSRSITFRMPEDVPNIPPVTLSPVTGTTHPTQVTLMWRIPVLSQRNGVITRYSVIVCQTVPMGNCTNHNILNGVQTMYPISLHPNYEYTWSIAAHTAVGPGPYSSPAPFRVPEDAPSGQAQNVTHGVVTSSSIDLSWSPPLPHERNGNITGYTVQVLTTSNSVFSNQSTVDLTLTLHSLEEYTSYMIRISAVTSVGEGPFRVYGPVTTAIGWRYGLYIAIGPLVLLILIIAGFILYCVCWRKSRKYEIKATTEENHNTYSKQGTLARLYDSENSKSNHKKQKISREADTNHKAKPQTGNGGFFQKMRNWLKREKVEEQPVEQPPIPMRLYLEDDNFMEEHLEQPAIPERYCQNTNLGSQSTNEEPAIPPPSHFRVDFFQGLENFVAERVNPPDDSEEEDSNSSDDGVAQDSEEEDLEKIFPKPYCSDTNVKSQSTNDERAIPPPSHFRVDYFQGLENFVAERVNPPDDSEEEDNDSLDDSVAQDSEEEDPEKIYQPLIPPRRYEENHEEETGVYQSLTLSKAKEDPHVMERAAESESQTVNNSEGHYQPLLIKQAKPSVYKPISLQRDKTSSSCVTAADNNSEGHYQSLVKREESSHYQSLTLRAEGATHTLAGGETGREDSEGHYQALVRQRESENSTYQSLTFTKKL